MAVFAFEQWMMASNNFSVNSFAKKGLKPKWHMVKFCRKPNCSISLSPDRLQYLQLPPFWLKFQMPPKLLISAQPIFVYNYPDLMAWFCQLSSTITNHLNANYSQWKGIKFETIFGKVSAQPHTIVKQIRFPNGNVLFLSLFSLFKNWMHNVGWGCAEILPYLRPSSSIMTVCTGLKT